MKTEFEPESLQQVLLELAALRQEIKVQKIKAVKQRRIGVVVFISVVITLGLGGIWFGPFQVQAQTGTSPKVVIHGQDTDLPKFCAGCSRRGIDYPDGYNLGFAYLAGADYANSDLSNSVLSYAELRFANFFNAGLKGSNLFGVDASHANFYLAKLDDTFLDVANLSNTDIRLASFLKSSLSFVNLSGAFLEDAILGGADLANATLLGANGTPQDLSNVYWKNTICPDGTNTDTNGGTCDGHWLPPIYARPRM